ncbi:MAG: PIN domain-containing protein [Phycisphaerales bacterium]
MASATPPLVFIDTNILLDFYRARNEMQIELLEKIDKLHESLITSYQVEMEFKKNRQRAILEALSAFKSKVSAPTPPAFLKGAKTVGAIRSREAEINDGLKRLHERTKKLMLNPTGEDPVYQSAQRLFKCKAITNLRRDRDEKKDVRRRAWKRFMLGYPPRKTNDTSIGDAINWEWVIHCSNVTSRHVIIVSRDGDYGITLDRQSYINDWLDQEFRSRTTLQRRVSLTDRLTEAMKLLDVVVTEEDERSESELLESSASAHPTDYALHPPPVIDD